ncbi:aldo/keto reductase [Xanthomonas sp. NCPPB 2632]|uniref:aldo/keto reductase n=1 Tax=Xanthomonas sp. NCPPB 2632 TaxID=3240912 RepID=UPI00351916B7
MRYVKLGRTGLEISPVVLGCMTYGVPDRGNHAWTLDEAQSRPFLRKALDLGINTFDTANAYSDGTSEEIVGRALLPWSPLARGRLTRDWDEDSTRQQSDVFGSTLYGATEDADRATVSAVKQVAEARGVPRAQVALAWVAQREGITAPIVGASKPQHLDDAVAAIELTLTADEIATLEGAYTPRAIAGFE